MKNMKPIFWQKVNLKNYFYMIMLYTETMYIYIYIWLFCVAFTPNKSHWNTILLLRHWISRNKTLMQFMF